MNSARSVVSIRLDRSDILAAVSPGGVDDRKQAGLNIVRHQCAIGPRDSTAASDFNGKSEFLRKISGRFFSELHPDTEYSHSNDRIVTLQWFLQNPEVEPTPNFVPCSAQILSNYFLSHS